MSLVLSFDSWPEADRSIWTALLQKGGPFDDRGALSHLRAASVEALRVRYGRWLCWLALAAPEALNEHPAARATLPRLRGWLEDLAHTKPMSRLMFVDGLLRVLTAIAPEADWSTHLRLKAVLKRAAGRGDPERKRGRIFSSRLLLQAGLRLAGPEADRTENPLQRALQQRDGTMVAVLATMPLRLRSFTHLEIGTSVRIHPDAVSIILSEDLTKTGVPWEADLPEPAASALRSYLTVTRPFLMERGHQVHDRVWVDKKGRPLQQSSLRLRVAETTLKITGKRVSPHLFRDAVATTLARESPESARLVRPILAHSGFETAERHYIHAQTIDAGRQYASVLANLKKTGGR